MALAGRIRADESCVGAEEEANVAFLYYRGLSYSCLASCLPIFNIRGSPMQHFLWAVEGERENGNKAQSTEKEGE